MKSLAIMCAGVLGACLVNAQEFQRFTFDAGAGFTQPVGNTGRHLDVGWNAGAGAGMNFNQYFGVMVQANYTDMGINSGILSNVGVPGGDVSIWSFTLDPRVHLTPKGHFDLYLVGGGGWYRRNQEFTAPGTAIVGDPFFGASFQWESARCLRRIRSISRASTWVRVWRWGRSGTPSFLQRRAGTICSWITCMTIGFPSPSG